MNSFEDLAKAMIAQAEEYLFGVLKEKKIVIPKDQLSKRVRKVDFTDVNNYWEYWLDSGTGNPVFLFAEVLDFYVDQVHGLQVRQILQDHRLNSRTDGKKSFKLNSVASN